MNMNINQMNQNMVPNHFLNNIMNNQFATNQNFNQINPNIINMNQMYQNFNQINPNMINMNQNLNNNNIINQIDEAEDVLPYINEPKIIIKFSTVSSIKKGTYITVKLPKSITKSDLYSIAKKYQEDYYSKIILSCNNYLLKEDDTTIEGIEEGSIINIIEDIEFPDGFYYRELMKKNENFEKVDFYFRIHCNSNVIKQKIQFPKNITVSEMEKGALSKLLLNSKSYKINEFSIINYGNKISSLNKKIFDIYPYGHLENHWRFGKLINAIIYENEIYKCNVSIGILNSVKDLIYNIYLRFERKDLEKLSIGNHEFLVNEIGNFSLKSIGINKDVNCKVVFSNSYEHF